MKNTSYFKAFSCITFILASYNLISPAPVFASPAGSFYLTGAVGGFRANTKHIQMPSQVAFIANLVGIKSTTTEKQNAGLEISAGIGWQATEKLRLELAYTKPFIKRNYTIELNGNTPIGNVNINASAKINTLVDAIHLKAYYDILAFANNIKVHIGAGVGSAIMRNKFSPNVVGSVPPGYHTRNFTTAPKANFTWLAAIGASYQLQENIDIALEYNYQDFGQVRDAVWGNKNERIHGHAIITKLNFSF